MVSSLARLLSGCGGGESVERPQGSADVTSSATDQAVRTTAPATTTRAPSASPATTRPTGRVIDVTKAGLGFFATPSRRIQCLIVAAGGDAAEYVRCGITGANPAGRVVAYGEHQVRADHLCEQRADAALHHRQPPARVRAVPGALPLLL